MDHMHSNGMLEKRGSGRPNGLGRVPGSGRKPGTPNRTTAELREQITAARRVEFLIKVAEGRRVRIGPQAGPGFPTYAYTSLEQRLRAAELLMKKPAPIPRRSGRIGSCRRTQTKGRLWATSVARSGPGGNCWKAAQAS